MFIVRHSRRAHTHDTHVHTSQRWRWTWDTDADPTPYTNLFLFFFIHLSLLFFSKFMFSYDYISEFCRSYRRRHGVGIYREQDRYRWRYTHGCSLERVCRIVHLVIRTVSDAHISFNLYDLMSVWMNVSASASGFIALAHTHTPAHTHTYGNGVVNFDSVRRVFHAQAPNAVCVRCCVRCENEIFSCTTSSWTSSSSSSFFFCVFFTI